MGDLKTCMLSPDIGLACAFLAITIFWEVGLLFWSCSCLVVLHIASMKKLLPKWIGIHASRVCFLPFLPYTLASRSTNYWSDVDETLLLGAVPLQCFGHMTRLKQLGVRGIINLMDEYQGG